LKSHNLIGNGFGTSTPGSPLTTTNSITAALLGVNSDNSGQLGPVPDYVIATANNAINKYGSSNNRDNSSSSSLNNLKQRNIGSNGKYSKEDNFDDYTMPLRAKV